MEKAAEQIWFNIRVEALPGNVNRILNAIAGIRGISKKDLCRIALLEFADRHRRELEELG